MKHLKETELARQLSKRSVDSHDQPCPYCTLTMNVFSMQLRPTRDHIRPKVKGKRRDNRVLVVCNECNNLKGKMTLPEFLEFLHARVEQQQREIEVNLNRVTMINYLVKAGLS